MVSDICDAFGVPPGPGLSALDQDYMLTTAVLDYRSARDAVRVFNGPDKKNAFTTLSKNPHLVEMLARMSRAQTGRPLDGGDVTADGMTVARSLAAELKDEGEEEDDGE